jgi:hypothetical protein
LYAAFARVGLHPDEQKKNILFRTEWRTSNENATKTPAALFDSN